MSNSNESSGIRRRQYTFNKRSSSLFKKAGELGVLCDADVAIIIFSHTGKLSHFSTSTSSVKEILTRFKDCVESLKVPAVQNEPDEPKEEEDEVLKEDVTNPEDKQLQILGKHLTGMSSQELQVLEQHLNEALLCIKERKEQILMQHLAQSRTQEEQFMLENETLRRQVQELQGVPPCTSGPASIYIQHPISETPCSHVNDEEPDTTLQLGPPTWLHKKSKAPEGDA